MRLDGFAARLLAVLLCGASGSACTATRFVPPGQAGLHESIEPGDRLRITMRDGRKLQLEVITVSPTELVGSVGSFSADRGPVAVPLAEVASVERVEFSAARTALIGIGMIIVAGTILVVSIIVTIMVGMGGG